MKRVLAGVLIWSVVVSNAYADAKPFPRRRFAIGVDFGAFGTPEGHVGIPIGGTHSDGAHMAAALRFRYEMLRFLALDFGVGLPHAALGLSTWASAELFYRPFIERRAIVALDLYAAPGLQLGFAGPDWAARHDNEWVGFGYVYQGPLAFAVRFAMGARLDWVRNRFDTFIEAVPMVVVRPSVDQLFVLNVGARAHF